MIKLLRVDHRLLHGQVAFSWKNAVEADCQGGLRASQRGKQGDGEGTTAHRHEGRLEQGRDVRD